MSFSSLLCGKRDVHPVLCQEIRRRGNPLVSCHLVCTQRITIVVVTLASQLANLRSSKSCLFSSSVSRPVSFAAGVEMVVRFSESVSRLIISQCLGSASHVIHLTIRINTLASLARSSSSLSLTMIIFVSNFSFEALHNYSIPENERFNISLPMPEHAWRCAALFYPQVCHF